MALLKCTCCGGDMDIDAEKSLCRCQYCGSVVTIPRELANKGSLYNRAIMYRQQKDFDKAIEYYEDILKADESDAEAHWGLVLSKYGIEYVEDPATKERIPTCNRVQKESILADPDYMRAVELFDAESSGHIKNEAEKINKIQTGILELSKKEPPYDVFICYKETDENGERTQDSVQAQELYYQLEKKGYRVFFARKTLEQKLGSEYEPIIYGALTSAKVMVVLGLKPEYFESVWVRNEWSRYLKMTKDEAEKIIIPVYKDFSPYELPKELSNIQALDMNRLGFLQDLIEYIGKILKASSKSSKVSRQSSQGNSLERLVEKSEVYLNISNIAAANDVFKKMTADYPEDYRGWWGLIICKTDNFSRLITDQSGLNVWFGYVQKLAPENEYEAIKQKYLSYTKKVAAPEAEKEIKGIKNKIESLTRKYESEIESAEEYEQSIPVKKKEIVGQLNTYTENMNSYMNRINSCKRKIAIQHFLNFAMILFVVLFVAIVAAAVILEENGFDPVKIENFIDTLFMYLQVINPVFCIILKYILSKVFKGTAGDFKSIIKKCRSDYAKVQNDRNHLDSTKDEIIAEIRNKASRCKAEAEEIRRKITDCKKYINAGPDAVINVCFAERCSAFGIKIEVPSEFSKLRNSVSGY